MTTGVLPVGWLMDGWVDHHIIISSYHHRPTRVRARVRDDMTTGVLPVGWLMDGWLMVDG